MSVKAQLALLGGVFLIGGLGGASLLHTMSQEERSSDERASDDEPAERAARARQAAAPVDGRVAKVAEGVEATPKDPGIGLAVTDVIGTLEAAYQASLARPDERAAVPPAPQQAQLREPAPVADRVAPAPVEPTATELEAPVEVAAAEPVQVVQGDVNMGNTNVTNVTNVTETTNQVSQLVVMGSPYYPGAYYPGPTYVDQPYVAPTYAGQPGYGQRRTQAVAPQKPVQGSITARDRSPWGSTDYSTHYENPWGPTWGRHP